MMIHGFFDTGEAAAMEDVSRLPASEALFLGASFAHIARFQEVERQRRIDQQNRIIFDMMSRRRSAR